MSGLGNSTGQDPLDLASGIGTWVAAFVAVVALVGVVGPWLALQAALSERNRALSAVLDVPQRYVSRGWRPWGSPRNSSLRLFRKITVPDISAPGRFSRGPVDGSCILRLAPGGVDGAAESAAAKTWVLRTKDYEHWNTGWAKFCQLLDAYGACPVGADVSQQALQGLDLPKDGSLDVISGHTSLQTSRYWVLLVGLLGRYGNRKDKGVLHKSSIRRNLDEERVSMRPFNEDQGWNYEFDEDTDSEGSEREVKPFPAERGSLMEKYSDNTDDSMLGSEMRLMVNVFNTLARRLSAFKAPDGSLQFTASHRRSLHGVTGTFQSLGRQETSTRPFKTISFAPHGATQIFGSRGHTTFHREALSLDSIFWLANGFLPTGLRENGRDVIYSIEDPPSRMMEGDALRGYRPFRWRQKSKEYFHLIEAEDIPISMSLAMRSLGLQPVKIYQLAMVNPKDPVFPQPLADGSSAWTLVNLNDYWSKANLHRSSLENMASAVLRLDWDQWGYLVWKHGCRLWNQVLTSRATVMTSPRVHHFILETLAQKASSDEGIELDDTVFDWNLKPEFQLERTADFLRLEDALSQLLDNGPIRPLRVHLGTLFIVDAHFKATIDACIRQLTKNFVDPDSASSSNSSIGPNGEDKNSADNNGKDQSESEAAADTTPATEPKPEQVRFQYSFATSRLSVIGLTAAMTDSSNSNLDGSFDIFEWTLPSNAAERLVPLTVGGNPGLPAEVVQLEAWCVVLAALKAATRAALWLTALDSRPLLKFVEGLDEDVYLV